MIYSFFKKIAGNKVKPFDSKQGVISYSQCGEDLIVQYVFRLRGIEYPSYIDIGASDPFKLSNTAIFYQKGCKGINIEANPTLIQKFITYRNQDVNLNVGIATQESVMDFYIMNDDTLSTFSYEEAQKMVGYGNGLREVVKVPTKTIEQVIKQYNNGVFPDFLSIDVEGGDFEILQSINFESTCPKVICVEVADYSPIGAGKRRDNIIGLLNSNNYYEYACTNLNAIFVHNDFWFIE